jgi:hypothetical protein
LFKGCLKSCFIFTRIIGVSVIFSDLLDIDERTEAFTSLLWDGVYDYSYIARATTPGTFIAPPAKAEEMYSPEVFGRSGSDWVVVE